MESSSTFDSRRKSSCATIVPPTHSKYNARKASLIPLKINTAGTKNLFYDTGSMTEISPTTKVSFKGSQEQQHKPSWIHKKLKLIKLKIKKTTTTESSSQFGNTHQQEKQQQQQHPHQSSRVVRHSYSDPRLSPGSTAVGDDDEEQQGYFSAMPKKTTKRTPRGWVAAVLMIVFGALIAVTFVLVGLGKALSGSSNVASVQSNSTTTAISNATSTTATVTDQKVTIYLPTVTPSASSAEATVTVTKAIALVHKVIKSTAIST
ncbi:hypothetical protein HMPREF1544_01698 [Mucor circinelloides 1006PhL]|uniref:Uncharacterized protein n=1 Tax=Mucor circinelloides f. circinelloides (strain 1006PhL) TaxID=1220926 RepID=S2JSF7_MUCC1|nr:hypothetical protein HMPREF1544_01698 [Mucor circinelloides 1006PhL]KAG1078440.1 hypothetical protein G6F42_024263 [Rhizopus arrhizus]